MSAYEYGPGTAPNTRELQLARDDLGMLNQRYVGIAKGVAKEGFWMGVSSIPVIGIPVDAAFAIGNAFSGNWGDAALDVAGMFPVFGDGAKAGIKGTKIAARTARQLERLGGQIADARTKVRSLETIAKKKAQAAKYWKAQKGPAYEKLKEDLKKCKTKECRKKKIKKYEEGKYKNIPKKGTWDGARGNSKWQPEPGSEADKALKEYGRDGVEYRNGKPDFSPFVKTGPDGRPVETPIPEMRGNYRRGPDGDFGQANASMRERYDGWSAVDEEGYTWHHHEDTSTMQLVDERIHNTTFGGGAHAGGSSAVRDPTF